MLITRRELLSMSAVAPFARVAAADDRADRIRAIVSAFESQGIHRTGTDIDRRSAEWLAAEVRKAGLTPSLEPFALSRVDIVSAKVLTREKIVDGIPLFDAAFTDGNGARGRIGPVGSDAEIGLTEAAPNTAASGALGEARRAHQHKALVVVTRGGRPGLCPSNADSFLAPFGPPAVQVSSEESSWLTPYARRNGDIEVVANVARTPVDALNVTATLSGRDRSLPPLVIMTPRSGWWTCASERGGGIACWLELMRELRKTRTKRDVVFVASSGHELGHLGINAFVDRRPNIVENSAGWIHLGANVGAAQDPGNTIQASDDEFERRQADAMTAAGLPITRRNPRGTIPGGEAEVVHRGGGRYMSIIGRNALFHNPADRGPGAIDAVAISRFVDAFTHVARGFASD
jgi:hypothetical protein